MVKSTDLSWIRHGLSNKGYLAKDLARAWGVSESSVSRFLQGKEHTDLPLSRTVTLALMLDLSLEEIAKGLGVMGKQVEPEIALNADAGKAGKAGKLLLNTIQLTLLGDDNVRLTLSQDTTPMKAMEVMKVFATK